ncbi:Uncharacterised protein [Vibrio cholerae]|nr:Uncharacterised protein [Vibrio cholerae]
MLGSVVAGPLIQVGCGASRTKTAEGGVISC